MSKSVDVRTHSGRDLVLYDIQQERIRQLDLKAMGRFTHTPSDEELSDTIRLAILMEEVGEVARDVLASYGLVQDGNPNGIRTELVQVAAICVAWIEGIDARNA